MILTRLFQCAFTIVCAFTDSTAQDTIKRVEVPNGYTSQIDVIYTSVSDWDGRMDLYLAPVSKMSTPIVINIHGGGWNHGDKESQTGFSTFFKMGYSVANVEYRLTGQATAPAAIEDVRCALIYLINHSEELNIDVNKIIIMGGSAGAHLALMAGLLADNDVFDTNCSTTKEVKVAAIIDKYGIIDVWDWGYGKEIKSKSAINWLGAYAKDAEFTKSVSPMYQINKDSPPVFIVHGDADKVVPYQQSIKLKSKLDELGVLNDFMTIEGGGHGGFSIEQNRALNARIVSFLKRVGL